MVTVHSSSCLTKDAWFSYRYASGETSFHSADSCANFIMSRVLQQAEETYNSSKIEWHSKHQEAILEKNQCLNPLQQLQGKLKDHSSLAEKHEALVKEHAEAQSKLVTLEQSKKESDDSRATLQDQVTEIKQQLNQAEQKLAVTVKHKEGVVKDLQTKLQIAQDELAQKSADIKSLQEIQQECTESKDSSLELDLNLKTVTSFVQNRAERMCRME